MYAVKLYPPLNVLAGDATLVAYVGTAEERYLLTVPAEMHPGDSGDVSLSGTWASNRTVHVTADETVTLTGSLGDSRTLDIAFDGIDLQGSNETVVSTTKEISVGDIQNVLFGSWEGRFHYNVSVGDAAGSGGSETPVVNTVARPTLTQGTYSYTGDAITPAFSGYDSEKMTLTGDTSATAEGSYTATFTPKDGYTWTDGSTDAVHLTWKVVQYADFKVTSSNRAKVGYTGAEGENLVIPATFTDSDTGVEYKVTAIEQKAFYNCKDLTSVTIPEGVTSIGQQAFYNCKGLISVTIPNSVTSIGISAFNSCENLTSITIPGSVTEIKRCAFSYCTSLTDVTIPGSVTEIGDDVFCFCTSLINVYVDSSNERYEAIDGVLFENNADGSKTLVAYPAGKTSASYQIPEGVTKIGDGAFRGCENLTSITIPGSVTEIGSWAFYDCENLTDVTISECVTEIKDFAFRYCKGLTSITIPGSVTKIGDSAFSECTWLTTININKAKDSISGSPWSAPNATVNWLG